MNIKIIAGLIFAVAIIMSGMSVSADYNSDKRIDKVNEVSTCNGDCANAGSGTCPYAKEGGCTGGCDGGCQKEGSTCGGAGTGGCQKAKTQGTHQGCGMY